MFVRANPFGWAKGDKLTPAQINQIDLNQSRSLDGVGGGKYTLAATLSLAGTGGLELAGSGAAAWLMLSPRLQVIDHPLVLATVVNGVGPTGSMPSAQLAPSDMTSVLGGMTVASGCLQSPAGALNAAQASYYVIELVRPPDGATLRNVALNTKGIGGSVSTVLPKYTLVQWAPAGALIPCSAEVTDDHTPGGGGANWTTSIRAQTVNANPNTVIAINAARVGVLVKNPFDVGSGASFRLYSVVASYDVTSLRF